MAGLPIRNLSNLGLKPQFNAQFAGTLLQQNQQLAPTNACKAMAAGNRAHTVLDNCNIVPIGEVFADRRSADGIVLLQCVERVVGQDHTPAERVIRTIAFDDCDLMGGVAQFHRDGEIQASRSAPKARNAHHRPSANYGISMKSLFYLGMNISSLNYLEAVGNSR